MYIVKKGVEYFFPKIDKMILKEAMEYLNFEEYKIFENMSKYDKYHCLEVYRKLKNTELKNDSLYLKLALLHDCGKEKKGIVTRILHKIGIRTELRNHASYGYEKVRSVNEKLGILIRNHHNKNYSEKMDIFQQCDDES